MSQEDKENSFAFQISDINAGERLDVVLSNYLSEIDLGELAATRSKVSQWISDGLVLLNSEVIKKASYKPRSGDEIQICIPAPKPLDILPDPDVNLDIVFEDEQVIVLNKQAGLVVHPAAGNYSGTLVHGLLAHVGENIKQVGDALRPGIVHRLDRDTSGLMVVAKTDTAYQALQKQFEPPRQISRQYLAIASAVPFKGRDDQGVIEGAIERHPKDRKKMAVSKTGGREAVTEWKIEKNFEHGIVLLRLSLTTGRTHQIRVHLKHAGATVLGDPLYGAPISSFPQKIRPAIKKLGRQALHAAELSFIHPTSQQRVSFCSELPADMAELCSKLST